MSSPANKLPAKSKQHGDSLAVSASATWSGPLPSPADLKRFDEVLQGGAERIFRMAEEEQTHRMAVERNAMDANIESSRRTTDANIEAQKSEADAIRRGTYLGTVISGLSIIAAVFSAYIGAHPSVSVALVGVPIMSAVRAIILRK